MKLNSAVSSHLPALDLSIESPLKWLHEKLHHEMGAVDEIINHYTQNQVPLVPTLTKHIINAGGKRLRPLLTLAASACFTPPEERILYLAAAIEFIHTATLLHDDVIDDSDVRRGVPSAHRIWNNSASVLVGDFLFARAFELMVKTRHLDVLNLLANVSSIISSGEVLQLTHAHALTLDEETALKIAGAKTAELFGACCQAGALMAEASSEDAIHLYNYGYHLGLVFQLTDDILDYTQTVEQRGKNIGDDFSEGKVTLPVIYAYRQASPEARRILERVFEHPSDTRMETPQYFQDVYAIIQDTGGFTQTYHRAKQFRDAAQQSLEKLPNHVQGEYFQALGTLLDVCLNRQA